jgi:hypothetical protein
MTNDDYEIGYGKPPEHTKFKKGKSGNPKGCPKKKRPSLYDDPIKAVLREEIRVVVNGKSTKMPVYRAILLKHVKKALEGDVKSTQLLFNETNALAKILDEKKRELNEADEAYIDDVLESALKFQAEYEKKENSPSGVSVPAPPAAVDV